MARKRLSEFRAKSLLYRSLDTPYSGVSFHSSSDFSILDQLDKNKTYVLKVDEGIKKRNKKGLVILNKNLDEVKKEIKRLQKEGYQQFLIEEFVPHESSDEKYLAIERVREGYQIYYSIKGGVDIEENQKDIKKKVIPVIANLSISEGEAISSHREIAASSLDKLGTPRNDKVAEEIVKELGLPIKIFEKLIEVFDKYYFSFLEINPFILHPFDKLRTSNSSFIILDSAVEVDSAAEFFTNNTWDAGDFVEGGVRQKTVEEKAIEELSSKSQASFKLDVLNPNGSIFMLLSGGGASIVLADEVANLGYGHELANYGEYSGNPNEEETYLYTKNLLSLLVKSKARQKVLIIAGGVANFTDVRITFRGIIKAIDGVKEQLVKQNVKVFVRRGGPYQEEGLKLMREFLEKEKLFGEVSGPEMVLTEIIGRALGHLKS